MDSPPARTQPRRQRGSQVEPGDFIIAHEFLYRAGFRHTTLAHDVCPIDDVERLLDVVIGDQHADAPVPQAGDDALDVMDGNRVHPGERFVEQHELRFTHQRPGDLQPTAFATAEGIRRAPAQVADRQLFEHPLEHRRLLRLRQRLPLEDGADVLLDGELPEHRRLLRQVADAVPRTLVHRPPADVAAVEHHPARLRANEPDEKVERRGLAGAVRAQETDDLALAKGHRDIINDATATEALAEADSLDERCRHFGFGAAAVLSFGTTGAATLLSFGTAGTAAVLSFRAAGAAPRALGFSGSSWMPSTWP